MSQPSGISRTNALRWTLVLIALSALYTLSFPVLIFVGALTLASALISTTIFVALIAVIIGGLFYWDNRPMRTALVPQGH